MASINLQEDCEIAGKENIKHVDKSKIPQRIRAGEKRAALRTFNNGVRQENKRIKIEHKENVIIEEQNKAEKEEKPKLEIDTDLIKIVSVEDKNNMNKDVAQLSSSNKFNHLTEFSEDIMSYYKETECFSLPKKNYMDKQSHVTWPMRTILVDWLVSVADEYAMSQDALYAAVNYIDRFLSKISVVSEKLQLVGASAMLIAGKMEDIYPPMPQEWAYLTSDTYSVRQIKKMEQLIVKVLEFRLQSPTSYTFLQKFCTDHDIDESTKNLALYLTELALLEGDSYLSFKPSEIAAASILYARFNLLKPNIWPSEIEKASGYTIKHLSPIVQAQSVTLKESPHKPQQTVQEKYKSPKFGRIALMKPRSIRLNFLTEPSAESESCSVIGSSDGS